MTSDRASILYYAIKTHYTSSYNAVTYNYHISIKQIPQNQYYVFERLAQKHKRELKYFYVCTLFENPKVWVGDLLSSDADDIFIKWKKRMQSLSYCFKNEMHGLLMHNNLKELVNSKKSFPVLLRKVLQEKISVDTLLILDSMLKLFDQWDKTIGDDIIWIENRERYVKYRCFMNYDIEKMKKILIEEVKCCR